MGDRPPWLNGRSATVLGAVVIALGVVFAFIGNLPWPSKEAVLYQQYRIERLEERVHELQGNQRRVMERLGMFGTPAPSGGSR